MAAKRKKPKRMFRARKPSPLPVRYRGMMPIRLDASDAPETALPDPDIPGVYWVDPETINRESVQYHESLTPEQLDGIAYIRKRINPDLLATDKTLEESLLFEKNPSKSIAIWAAIADTIEAYRLNHKRVVLSEELMRSLIKTMMEIAATGKTATTFRNPDTYRFLLQTFRKYWNRMKEGKSAVPWPED